MIHIHGTVVTKYGLASNNRGETEGNISTLHKIMWKGKVHTTVSAESIKFAIREYFEKIGLDTARKSNPLNTLGVAWDPEWFGIAKNALKKGPSAEIDAKLYDCLAKYVDLDLFGFMLAKGEDKKQGNKKDKNKSKSLVIPAIADFSRAISTSPYKGDMVFSVGSAGATDTKDGEEKDPTPYNVEVHATRYQYSFSLTPTSTEAWRSNDPEVVERRIVLLLEAIANLNRVGGCHANYLYDFSPEYVFLRITHDPAPRILNIFEFDEEGNLTNKEYLNTYKAQLTKNHMDNLTTVCGPEIDSNVDAAYELKNHIKDAIKIALEG